MKFAFHDDLNLVKIYNDIKSILEDHVNNKNNFEEEYKRLCKIAEKSHNPSDRIRASKLKREKEYLLIQIRNNTLVQNYDRKVSYLVYEYLQLTSGNRIFGMDNCINVPKRVGIILSFLEKSKEFIDITWNCNYDMEKICLRCYSIMKKIGCIYECKCGYSYKIEKTVSVSLSSGKNQLESSYDSVKNYRKEYMHLCGLINDLEQDEKENIESYLYRANLKEYTHEHIRNAMQKCGYENYHDINYLYHLITGEPLPNIDKYIEVCVSRFESYYNVFHTLNDKEGHSITNLHFCTKLFLWQEGIPYEEKWFRSLSENTENKHRRNARKVCAILQKQCADQNWKVPSNWL